MNAETTTIAANLLEAGMILGNGMPVLAVRLTRNRRTVSYDFATPLGPRSATASGIDSIVIRKD